MSLRLTTRPAAEPVDLDYFQAHSKIDAGGSDDADAQAKLTAAIRGIEQETGRDRLLQSTWEFRLPCFPCVHLIELPLPQVQSISHIKYTDSAGVLQTMTSGDYHIVGEYSPVAAALDAGENEATTGLAWVFLNYGKSWPAATLQTGLPVVITFVAGWAAPENVPEDLKAAICMQGAHLWRNREAVTIGRDAINSNALARGVESLISPYRMWRS